MRPAGARPGPAAHDPAHDPAHELDLREELHRLEEEDRPPAAGAAGNLAAALVVTAVGVGAVAGAASLGVGAPRDPGPGTFPLLTGVALTALGVALAVRCRSTRDAERFSPASLLVLAGVATMVLFVAVVSTIGFEIPAVLLTFVWLRFIGREGWRLSVLTSLVVVVVFYTVFVGVLQVPIPHMF